MGKKNINISEKTRKSTYKRSKAQKAKQTELLGESVDKAWYYLKKNLLFDMAQKLKMDTCYRCKQRIISAEELSIDHKQQWMESNEPRKYFYDLNNIAFSHSTCNYQNEGKQRFYLRDGGKSEFRGVDPVKNKNGDKYQARIKKDNKHIYLGRFESEIEAAKAYDKKAIEFWGENAITNESLGLFDKNES